MEGFRVKCCTCLQVMYETTEFYNCHQPLTGDQLRLLPLYNDWPTYDGSLASKGTSRFLMFCSYCGGYISTTGKLNLVDFPDVKVTEVSEERSEMSWRDSFVERGKPVDNLIIPDTEDSALVDEPRVREEAVTPKEMMKKLEKRTKTSSKKKRK